LEENEGLRNTYRMHYEALKIYLADTHIQPSTTRFGGQGNFLLNLNNGHSSYTQIFNLFCFRPDSILQLARCNPLLVGL
jgi:hypothetical protein